MPRSIGYIEIARLLLIYGHAYLGRMQSTKRVLVIFLDGATDDPIPLLNGKTPLQASNKPFIDSIASNGTMGCTMSRDYTHFYLLELFTGVKAEIPRGVIEAYGMELPLDDRRVAYRMSPAKIENGKAEWYYKISCQDEMNLQKAVLKSRDKIREMDPKVYFYNGGKAVMTVKGTEVLNLPKPPAPADVQPHDLGDFGPFAESIADMMGGITLLPWGGGSGKEAESFRKSVRPIPPMTMISKSPSALGVAAFLNIKRERVAGFKQGIKLAKDLIKKEDVFLHIEETDDISHKRSPREKVEIIEAIDKELNRHVKDFSQCRLVLLVDHGASSLSGDHIRMEVPYAISDKLTPFGTSRSYAENGWERSELPQLLEQIYRF
ncbi:MAG: 2,3-bisphosphoglycerate-independent phosphoglycerate mutase 2 [Methanomassiliicoccales archaeon PtaU1.Bin124]|nr:MAG: 2,3-bisphosphoglycerate-independent phosphoglycerate mutase 2 [Methanomassiliicoccales archaeon PtaU1.Bin124]